MSSHRHQNELLNVERSIVPFRNSIQVERRQFFSSLSLSFWLPSNSRATTSTFVRCFFVLVYFLVVWFADSAVFVVLSLHCMRSSVVAVVRKKGNRNSGKKEFNWMVARALVSTRIECARLENALNECAPTLLSSFVCCSRSLSAPSFSRRKVTATQTNWKQCKILFTRRSFLFHGTLNPRDYLFRCSIQLIARSPKIMFVSSIVRFVHCFSVGRENDANGLC